MLIEDVGVLHPGEMGVTVAGAARTRCRVHWVSDGRSPATRERAKAAGLDDARSLDALVGRVGCLVSVCPPSEAVAVAEAVAERGFGGLYVDANAVSPETAKRIAERVEAGGARAVDGGLIGPPAVRPGTTTLHLSGPCAEEVAAVFEGSALAAHLVPGGIGAASALKMAFAAWTKGQAALLLAVAALARELGVEDALHARWASGMADLPDRIRGTAAGTARKAWRFEGEMEEIARTFADAGLPDGFHRAAGEVYRRMAVFKDGAPDPEAVLDALRHGSRGSANLSASATEDDA